MRSAPVFHQVRVAPEADITGGKQGDLAARFPSGSPLVKRWPGDSLQACPRDFDDPLRINAQFALKLSAATNRDLCDRSGKGCARMKDS